MKTAIETALIIFGIAVAISMCVAALMKGMFVAIRWLNSRKG